VIDVFPLKAVGRKVPTARRNEILSRRVGNSVKVEEKGEEEKVVEFKEVYRGGLGSDGQLTELVDKTFVIQGVEIQEMGKYGEVAIATIELNSKVERRHTFSAVLIKQLKALKEFTDKGKKVKCTLRKVKRYYTLE
jgi:hypothetical protein